MHKNYTAYSEEEAHMRLLFNFFSNNFFKMKGEL